LEDADASPNSTFELQLEINADTARTQVPLITQAFDEWYFDTTENPITLSRAMNIKIGVNHVAKGNFLANKEFIDEERNRLAREMQKKVKKLIKKKSRE